MRSRNCHFSISIRSLVAFCPLLLLHPGSTRSSLGESEVSRPSPLFFFSSDYLPTLPSPLFLPPSVLSPLLLLLVGRSPCRSRHVSQWARSSRHRRSLPKCPCRRGWLVCFPMCPTPFCANRPSGMLIVLTRHLQVSSTLHRQG